MKALRWAITDAALFHGVEGYSEETPTAHLYADRLREMCASMYAGDRQLRFGEFEDAMPMEGTTDALAFFDSLNQTLTGGNGSRPFACCFSALSTLWV